MMKLSTLSIASLSLGLFPSLAFGELLLREDFKETWQHLGISSTNLVHQGFLSMELAGDHQNLLKSSHHEWMKDPYYFWNGPTKAPTAVLLKFSSPMNLSDQASKLRVNTRHSGKAESFPLVQSEGNWYVSHSSLTGQTEFITSEYAFHKLKWVPFDPASLGLRLKQKAEINWNAVTGIGFFNAYKGQATIDGVKKSSTRMNWFEIHSSLEKQDQAIKELAKQQSPKGRPAPERPFFEATTPFYHSSVTVPVNQKTKIEIPRAVLIRLNPSIWSCFDIDTQQLVAVWKSKTNFPVTLDSMASMTYPDKLGKAKIVPRVDGELVYLNSAKPAHSDSKWLGVQAVEGGVVVRYSIGDRNIPEQHRWDNQLTRTISISPGKSKFSLPLASSKKSGLSKSTAPLLVNASERPSKLELSSESLQSSANSELITKAAKDPYPQRFNVWTPEEKVKGSYFMNIPLCEPNIFHRGIRPTDIEFTKEGIGYITTFDGDVWSISQQNGRERQWKRVAAGFNGSTNLEITQDGKILAWTAQVSPTSWTKTRMAGSSITSAFPMPSSKRYTPETTRCLWKKHPMALSMLLKEVSTLIVHPLNLDTEAPSCVSQKMVPQLRCSLTVCACPM